MREELELNRRHWDEATRLHTTGNVYGIENFKQGQCALHRVEREEMGDVQGKRLLHLQCHFGLDTLSWARRGAIVTGVDFSSAGIEAAEQLSRESGVPGRFVCSDLYSLRDALPEPGSFDIVFTSYGVLSWLPDLTTWGLVVAYYLARGGFFYIVEAHPSARMFPMDEDMPQAKSFKPWFPYFHDPAGVYWPPEPDYADTSTRNSVGEHAWQHSMSDIVNALIGAGLRIDTLHEFPFCAWPVVAGCELVEPGVGAASGYYGRPASEPQLPLMFSLRATR